MREQPRKNSPPKKRRGAELCIAVTKNGTSIYGNKAAFHALAEWMSWIAEGKTSSHRECHLVWHLLNKFAKKRNVFVLVDQEMSRVLGKGGQRLLSQVELTFMAVEPADLRALRKYQSRGVLAPATGPPPNADARHPRSCGSRQ
jgi:hypothetical protein